MNSTVKPMFSPSQIEVWMECPQQWDYAYVKLLKKKTSSKKHFDVGNYFHELSHVYYQLLREGRKAGDSFTLSYMESRIRRDLEHVLGNEEMTAIEKASLVETINLVKKMLTRFIQKQSPVIDAGIIVVDIERHLQAEFVTPNGNEVILHGFADLIYRDRAGKLRIRDHKTGANPSSWTQKKVQLLSQLLIYSLIYEQETETIVPSVEISYVNSYNYVKEPANANLFALYRHEHNEAALRNFRKNILMVLDQILGNEPYRRLNSNCSSCQFFDLCDHELRGHDSKNLQNTMYVKVNRDYADSLNSKITGETIPAEENSSGDQAVTESNPFVLRWNGNRIGS